MMPSSVSMQRVFNKMTRLKFALYVTCLLIGGMAFPGAVTLEPSSSLHFKSVSIGEDVTLECFYQESNAVMFHWFKKSLGQKPERMSEFHKYDNKPVLVGEFKKDPRFKLDISPEKYCLNITNVQTSDSATYHCMSSYNEFDFIGGVIVHVTSSVFDLPTIIHQSESGVIQHGASVTLNCTVLTGSCDGDLRVYWVKNSQEAHPGLISTHGGMNEECEREVNSQTHTCVYSLEMEKLNRSHAGTYHCAVASCGHVLLGDGTKLEIKDEEEDDDEEDVLVYVLSAALAFMTILAVFLAYKAFTKKETTSCICTGPGERASAVSGPNTEGDQNPENLHYSALSWNHVNPSARQRDNNRNECVYSGVRQ